MLFLATREACGSFKPATNFQQVFVNSAKIHNDTVFNSVAVTDSAKWLQLPMLAAANQWTRFIELSLSENGAGSSFVGLLSYQIFSVQVFVQDIV